MAITAGPQTGTTLDRTGPLNHKLVLTREQYLGLPDDGHKYDMIDGVLFVTPSAHAEHGRRQSRLAQQIENYLDRHPVGQSTACPNTGSSLHGTTRCSPPHSARIAAKPG